jgi:DNA-binding transcriptional LysR family regulator
MNLRGVDLNLLTVLHALLEEAHVSRAASRLGMSQPATSSALERSRHLFGDPLLERVGSSMRLTVKGEALRKPLAEVMKRIGELLDVDLPPMSELHQSVHIAMADALGTYLGGALRAALDAAAPGINLVLHPWSGGSGALEKLARGSIDLAVSVLPKADERMFHVEALLEAHYVVAMRHDHPAAACFGLDEWLTWPHIIVSASGVTRTAVDDTLASLGRARRIGMVVPSFLLVPDLLRGSDLIALMPALALSSRAGDDLATFGPPIALEGFSIHIAWHRRRGQDRAVQYVASEVKRLLRLPMRPPAERSRRPFS